MGNVGYLAPPLMLPMLGPRIAGPVAMAIVAEVAVIIALGSMLMAPSAKGEGLKAVMAGLRGLMRNPVILSIALGALSAGLELSIPAPIERFLSQLHQRYALRTILAASTEEGFQVSEQTNQLDGSIELVVTRWDA
jgi:predicted permease